MVPLPNLERLSARLLVPKAVALGRIFLFQLIALARLLRQFRPAPIFSLAFLPRIEAFVFPIAGVLVFDLLVEFDHFSTVPVAELLHLGALIVFQLLYF